MVFWISTDLYPTQTASGMQTQWDRAHLGLIGFIQSIEQSKSLRCSPYEETISNFIFQGIAIVFSKRGS